MLNKIYTKKFQESHITEVIIMNIGTSIFCGLVSVIILINPPWFYDGRVVFDRQVIIENGSEYYIPFELNNFEGGRLKVYINSSEELRLIVLDDDNYLKHIDGEPHTTISIEDHITKFNQTYEIPYKGSFYIILYNQFFLNDDAIVDIKLEVFEFNISLFILFIVIIIIVIASIISLLLIYKKRKIKNKNFEIINLIMEKLPNIDDESDILDFKIFLPNKEKVAKMVSAFCNSYIMNHKESYIVFGVKDRKLMQEGFTIIERLLPIEMVLEKSLKNTKYLRTIENFKIFLIDILESQLDLVPDSCFNIKTLNLNGFGGISTDFYIIIIEFNRFKLSKPVEMKDGRIFIRSEGRNRRANDSDIAELKLKL